MNSCSEGSGLVPQTLLGAIFRYSFMVVWVGPTDLSAGHIGTVNESGTAERDEGLWGLVAGVS